MNLDWYEHSERYFQTLNFAARGRMGGLRKLLGLVLIPQNGITFFNLGFGDLNEELNHVDDQTITNNKDRDKILATVAAAVLQFTDFYSDMIVYAKGKYFGKDATLPDEYQCQFRDD